MLLSNKQSEERHWLGSEHNVGNEGDTEERHDTGTWCPTLPTNKRGVSGISQGFKRKSAFKRKRSPEKAYLCI